MKCNFTSQTWPAHRPQSPCSPRPGRSCCCARTKQTCSCCPPLPSLGSVSLPPTHRKEIKHFTIGILHHKVPHAILIKRNICSSTLFSVCCKAQEDFSPSIARAKNVLSLFVLYLHDFCDHLCGYSGLIQNQQISNYSLKTLGYCIMLFLQFGCALQAVSIPHLSCCSVRVDRNLAGTSTMAVNGRRHLPSVQEGDDLVL